jgi:hypothetical protein
MTIANAKVQVMPIPGTIVFVRGLGDLKDSKFGLSTGKEFFLSNANPRVVAKFVDRSSKSEQGMLVPVMVMTEDFSWGLRYCEAHNLIQFESLLDKEQTLNTCLARMECFTYRDGSRYYAKFLGHLLYYLKFLSGEKCLDEHPYMTNENPLERKYVLSLIEWRDEQRKGFFACTPS